MTDRYPYTIEDKGTIRQFKARRIIITCPRCPGEEYKMGNHGRHRSTNQANSPDRRSQRSRVSITT